MPGGRPSKYTPEVCDTVIALGKEGATKAEYAAELEISRQTLDNWCEAHPEFLDAVKRATDLAQAWWEKRGRQATFGEVPNYNATSFIFNMKNRFKEDWKDKVENEHSGPGGGPMLYSRIERNIIDPE